MNWSTLGRWAFLLAAGSALSWTASNAFGQSPLQQHARLSLISEHGNIVAGQPEWIGVRFALDPGWHIYWTNPGDSGEPPKVAWHLPAGMQASDLQFPTPKRIPDHSLMDYGYEGSVVLVSRLTTPVALASKRVEVDADVKYLVCREVCVPEKNHLSMTLPVAGSAISAPDAVQIETARAHLPQPWPRGVHISATPTQEGFLVTIAGKNPTPGKVTDFFPADEQTIENSIAPKITAKADSQVVTLSKSEQLDHPVTRLRGLLITGERAYNIVVPVTSRKTNIQKHKLQKKVKE